jgi:hypothetical protein
VASVYLTTANMLQPFGTRSVQTVQTAADSTKLASSTPEESSHPFTVTLDEHSFRGYRTEIPDLDVSVTKENLLQWFEQMSLMRKMEQAAGALYQAKLIRGFCHLAVGQVSTDFVRPRQLLTMITGSSLSRLQLCYDKRR